MDDLRFQVTQRDGYFDVIDTHNDDKSVRVPIKEEETAKYLNTLYYSGYNESALKLDQLQRDCYTAISELTDATKTESISPYQMGLFIAQLRHCLIQAVGKEVLEQIAEEDNGG